MDDSMWGNHKLWPHYNMFCIVLTVCDTEQNESQIEMCQCQEGLPCWMNSYVAGQGSLTIRILFNGHLILFFFFLVLALQGPKFQTGLQMS